MFVYNLTKLCFACLVRNSSFAQENTKAFVLRNVSCAGKLTFLA